MATRKQLWHPDAVREKIKATQLINRLTACAMGEIELSSQQVRAIEIVLRKCIPDLSSIEMKSETTVNYVAEVPAVMATGAEWEEKFGETHH